MAQRKRILAAFTQMGFEATIYRAGATFTTDLRRREACLNGVVTDILRAGHTFLCLESDETLDGRDRRQLAAVSGLRAPTSLSNTVTPAGRRSRCWPFRTPSAGLGPVAASGGVGPSRS